MMKSQFGKYLTLLSVTSLSILIFVGVFNWFIDPYDIYGSYKIDGFNSIKPEVRSHSRLVKAYEVQRIKPEAICLGTSSAICGIDPSHPGWTYKPVYNLGIPRAYIYEILRYFQHANNVQPLKQVVLCLDFLSFSNDKRNENDFDEMRLSVDYYGHRNPYFANDTIATLFSVDALASSMKTIWQQKSAPTYYLNGMELVTEQVLKAAGGNHAYFLDTEKSYATVFYLPEYYQFDNLNLNDSPFTYYRKLLQIAYQDNIDLRLTISPSHVRQWEVLAAAGLWPKFEEWKRALVTINEEEAHHFSKTPFPLWDFSTYNEFTTEDVPPLGNTEAMMHWYWDGPHYRKELGDLMLDRIFNYHVSGRVEVDNLALLLNSENINDNLEKIRIDREQYRNTHPEDIAEIEGLFK